jgi:hypothetical protein
MLAWITENIGTILISAVLLLVVVLIIRKLVKDKKKAVAATVPTAPCRAPATRSNKATGGETRMEASAFPLCLNRR